MHNRRILVVAAHPDDEVLGCGGTIRKFAGANQIAVLFMGRGLNARFSGGEKADPETAARHLANSRKVAELLGVGQVWHQDWPDNRFDTVPLLELAKNIEAAIAAFEPDIVFTHTGVDLNIDHRRTLEAVLAATRPLASCPVRELYSFAVPSATEWAYGQINGSYHPDFFVDITRHLDSKQQALQIYDSEIRPFPHPRSPEAVRAAAQAWGMVAGLHLAEAFTTIRRVA